ncbi:MAG: hypothetical protein HOU81_23830 [Hamadaea sp.]|uniref:hypothetical protein n=1 Tax=Hamadaea sp. TaxID=2024425 RepID=UPI0017FD1229|nr:hypothetical protein [Hamadaea sp.]NUR73854.1 hypothetical protein [Hamadaea sp.]NUT18981.1 hypothetical protein [Hamadaea sp.]
MKIEAIDDERHLVEIPFDEGPVEVLVRASPAAVAQLAPDGVPTVRVVEETIDFLLARQRADDLPPQLDLEDVLPAYEGFEQELRRRLSTP